MPAITALLHTHNDALRLGRALEMAYPFDEMIVIDHNSQDATRQIAHTYGARVIAAKENAAPAEYCRFAKHEWIFLLDPRESLSESLAASLFELKCASPDELARRGASCDSAFCVLLREETSNGWHDITEPQTRLVPRSWNRWAGQLPVNLPTARLLDGVLLRFQHP
jgi:glycosyltransferase involved in cell wall biosynthesis